MSSILNRVQLFLAEANKASVPVSSTIINEFGEMCKDAFKKQFTEPREKEFRPRMSNIGRPLCQLQMEKSGAKAEIMPYNYKMRNLYGDIIEAIAVAVLKLSGIKANADIPIKARYMIRDCKISAEKNNIMFKFNNYFPILTLNLMRCVIVAENKGFERNFINKVFEAIWIDGLNLNDSSILEKLLKNLEINPKVFLTDASDQKIKDDLKKRTEEAFSKGVFGTPSFVVNNKLFWGQDRLEFAISEANK